MRLAGKVVLISGGARGMGAAEAILFAREGARVVLGDILDAEGKRVEAEITGKGGEAVYVRLDVTSEADWERAVATAVSRFGRLDALVNNAGVLLDAGERASTVGLEKIRATLETNLVGEHRLLETVAEAFGFLVARRSRDLHLEEK